MGTIKLNFALSQRKRGSPLGSANDFSILAPKWSPAGISNFSPMDGASDDQFEITL